MLAASRRRDAARVVAPPARAGVLRRVTSVKFIEIDAVRLRSFCGVGGMIRRANRTQAQQSGEIMALGRRNGARQGEFWVATQQLPTSPGHVFYEKLNELLAEGKFDEWIEELCESYYAKRGRPGIRSRRVLSGCCWPGTSKGIGSRRALLHGGYAIPCRCAKFLGIAPTERVPRSLVIVFDSWAFVAAKSTMPYSLGFSSWPVRKDCSTGRKWVSIPRRWKPTPP